MDIRTRRRRRVAIIVVVALAITGAVAGIIFLQQWKQQRQDAHLRATGIEAYEAGRYVVAVEDLRRYLQHHSDDVEALYAYGKSSLETPQPNNRHLGQALAALNQVYQTQPGFPGAAHDLLSLRTAVGQNDQALELANALLAKDPRDTDALSSKAIVLMRTKHNDEALAAAGKAIEIDPDLYEMHLIRLQLRHQMGEPAEKLLQEAQALAEAHPQDPRYEMLLGYAFALAKKEDQAKKWLSLAAGREAPDEQFARVLLGVLDTAHLYDQSMNLLKRAGSTRQWKGLRTEMARRLFEAGQYEEVVRQLGEMDAADFGTPVENLALRAMSLYHLGRREEAQATRAALAKRDDSAQGPLWAQVLGAAFAQDPQVSEIIKACRNALATAPNNPYFHALLGDAYARIGDAELAIAAWREAARLRPSWSAIRARLALALLDRGQSEEASQFAREAYVRQPNNVANAIIWVRTQAASISDPNSPEARELLDLINQVQQAAPGEPQTLVLRVSMLAEMGRVDEASAAILGVLDSDHDMPQRYWLKLASLSRRYELGLDDRVMARVQKQEGANAELALTRATQMAREGKPQQGLALIEQGMKSAPQEHKAQWRMAWAMFLDALNDPRAAQAWKDLIESEKGNVRVQQTALQARVVQADRALTGKVVEQLRALMGDHSVTWRLAKARYLLESPQIQQDSAAAVNLLREVIEDAPKRVEPRLLLARALERLGRDTLAIGELRAADQAIPGSVPILLELARLHQKVRQFSGARNYLEMAAVSPQATADDLRAIARLFAGQGDDDRAIEVLQRLQGNPDTANGEQRLLLATLYHRAGQTAQAQTLLEQALEHPTPAALAFALRFYQSTDRPDQVQRIVALLDQADIPDGARERVLGDFYARAGDTDQAIALYRSRIAEAPENADAWRQLLAVQLAGGDIDAALQTADQGLAHVPDDAALRRVKDQARNLRATAGKQWARPLLVTLVTDAAAGEAAAQALGLIARAGDGPKATAELARQLRPLADQHQDVLSLQTAVARVYLQADQPREAADIASRASRTFPRAVEPTWLHAEALAKARQWLDALGAATQWRSRTTGSTVLPDMMIAEAQLQLGDPARAMESIEPHLQTALADPAAHDQVVSRYIRALTAMRRYDQAAKVLLPLFAQSASWRGLAMDLASDRVEQAPVASQWLAKAGADIPDDAPGERTALARAYWKVSQRLSDPAAADRARQILDRVVQRADAPAATWYMRGIVAEQSGDLATAEASYRAALERDGDMAVARNNLAMVLLNRGATGGELEEARRLAQAAVDASPANVFYLDTLAAVQARVGDADAAVATLKRAIELDPHNDTWKRNLAKILRDSGRDEEAQQILDQLEPRAAQS